MPEIGISGLPLDFPYSGSAVYVRELIHALPLVAPDLSFYLFTRNARRDQGTAGAGLISPFGAISRGHAVAGRADKLAWEIGSLPVASGLRRQALLHSTYFAAPLAALSPVVVTIHDVIPLVLPGYHRSRQAQLYSQLMAWNVPRSARAIITVSQHAKRDIVRMLKVPEHRVHVTYEAIDDRFRPNHTPKVIEQMRQKYCLPARYALYLGGAERRKNIETLVRAWAHAAKSLADRELKLVIVAHFPPPDALYPDIPGLVASLRLERDIVLVSSVDEIDKPALYAGATFFCFPSTYEGFGFPPLEAMASGVPVLCSDASSLPEVVGEAAWRLPADDVTIWSEAITYVAESESKRTALSTMGLAQAASFSWKRTAEQTARVYREVLSR